MPEALPSTIPPRLLSQEQAAEYMGLKPSTFAEKVKAGKLPPRVNLGVRRALWDRKALDSFLDAQSGLGEVAPAVDAKRAWLEAINAR